MVITLDKEQKDIIYNALSSEQKDFLTEHVKRGKKTIFANLMARDKGIILPDNATSEEIEQLLEEWVLEDYIDNGFVNPLTPCQCGKSLRYQYVVKHQTSKEIRTFGKTHFEEHTGISPKIVKDILRGFDQIDYELNDLLHKINNDWSIKEAIGTLPDGFTLSKEFDIPLSHGIPLLDRQINRLVRDIQSYLDEQEFNRSRTEVPIEVFKKKELKRKVKEENMSFNFEVNEQPTKADSYYQQVAYDLLKEGTTSVRIICELLIKKHHASSERYMTGKPKLYPTICLYFETLVEEGILRVESDKEMQDRQYYFN